MSSSLPISISESDFSNGGLGTTPLGKIAVRMAEAVVNTTWNEANVMKSELAAKVTAATTGFLDSATAPSISAIAADIPSVTAPNVSIPASIDTASILATYGTEYNEIITTLLAKFSTFFTSYFPNDTATYSAAETWLSNAIANPAGLPASVVTQILADDQARVVPNKQRAQDSVIRQFAARRFPLPSGPAASAILQIEQKAQDELAEASRKLMIMSIEQQKWNVEKILDLRKMAMSSAIDYLKTLFAGPDSASRVVGIGYDAQAKLLSSASDFYRADTSAKEMVSKVKQFNSTQSLTAAEKNQATEMALINAKVEALFAEIKSIAQMATSMYNNLHANAGVTASV